MNLRHCELCSADAVVYCPADAAFLCQICDAEVHGANFLVARHVRRSVCSNCISLAEVKLYGAGLRPLAICRSCYRDSDGGSGVAVVSFGDSSCSSDCISSATSPEKVSSFGSGSISEERRCRGGSRLVVCTEAEGVFADWCGKLGVVGADLAVRKACKDLMACSRSWTVVPFRVCLAASMCLGLRLAGNESSVTWQVLKRLECVSGVPARVILAAELKLERGLRTARQRLHSLRRHRRRLEADEGSAETTIAGAAV